MAELIANYAPALGMLVAATAGWLAVGRIHKRPVAPEPDVRPRYIVGFKALERGPMTVKIGEKANR